MAMLRVIHRRFPRDLLPNHGGMKLCPKCLDGIPTAMQGEIYANWLIYCRTPTSTLQGPSGGGWIVRNGGRCCLDPLSFLPYLSRTAAWLLHVKQLCLFYPRVDVVLVPTLIDSAYVRQVMLSKNSPRQMSPKKMSSTWGNGKCSCRVKRGLLMPLWLLQVCNSPKHIAPEVCCRL